MHQGTTFQYIGINLDSPDFTPPESSPGLAYAIDRDSIIRHLIKDLGSAASGLLSPLNWAYDESAQPMASRSG